MLERNVKGAFILGTLLFLGLIGLGLITGASAIKIKTYERTVTVKGLSEN